MVLLLIEKSAPATELVNRSTLLLFPIDLMDGFVHTAIQVQLDKADSIWRRFGPGLAKKAFEAVFFQKIRISLGRYKFNYKNRNVYL